jgi:hypothetical protein
MIAAPDRTRQLRKDREMKTSELSGAALDWAVAMAENWAGADFEVKPYSTDWAQGGPIIEREMIQITPHCMVNPLHGWAASYRSFDEDDDVYALFRKRGRTPLIAAMRCYVANKLGDTVEIPEELIK